MKRRTLSPWRPVAQVPALPPGDRVLIYCPSYSVDQRIRSIGVDFLPFVKDATHWCPIQGPLPVPPV